MLVFWKERLVFLAVPKTGSTAYESALGPRADIVVSNPPELKHAPIYRYNRFFRPMFEKNGAPDMESLAVVREPISWLGSWYRFRRRPFMEGKPNSTHGVTFDDFVAAYLEKERPAFANVGSQAKFLEPRPNGTRATYLFRYEEQGRLRRFLEARLNVTLETEQRNVSPQMELSLDPGLERKLRRRHADDFALWEEIGTDQQS
ncbi:gamma-glutamyl kinase [Pseudaestuariivita sp.]|uniref:gamma-glutamyl kinase n=1 Tax=Pseudaestuariivita sp. TaxID=2211669 RepID=UPI004059E72E